ncbi:hypothetical protein ACLB6G_13570 [Zhengella sp. ZM62]|uniref:hypothetical protein n=1 Tax=Zhengella sedimenti TaxID=3390035 RepID=UPI0039758CE9
MSAAAHDPRDPAVLLKGALTTGVANAIINGAIQAYLMAGHGPVALTVDAIGGDEHTVMGAAVMLATLLAMILTAVGHATLKAPKIPFVPAGLWLVLKHGLFAFGAIVALSILWQRLAGTIVVGVPAAVSILALVAGIVAAITHAMTIRSSVKETP